MLTIQNLSFSYESRTILDQLSLSLCAGEKVALVGASGSGKTTLFRLIAGLLSPTKGTIAIQGAPPIQGRSYLSYMMQEDLLLPWKTALENVLVVAEIAHLKKEAAARSLLEEVGLGGFENTFPRHLSGGMRQRVALARALLLERPLLILDEPFASIDSERKLELIGLIQSLCEKRRLTLLFITHDKYEASALADRVYSLEKGALNEVMR